MADNTPKNKNKTTTGAGLRSVANAHGPGAWRIGPAHDDSGKLSNTEDLYHSPRYRDKGNEGRAAGKAVSERMAGYSREGLRNDKERDRGSVWGRALGYGAAVGGAGLAGRSIWQQRNNLFAPALGRIQNIWTAQAPFSFAQGLASRVTANRAGGTGVDTASAIAKLYELEALGPATIAQLWTQAVGVSDPFGQLRGIVSAGDTDPIGTLTRYLSETGAQGPNNLQKVLDDFFGRTGAMLPKITSVAPLKPGRPGMVAKLRAARDRPLTVRMRQFYAEQLSQMSAINAPGLKSTRIPRAHWPAGISGYIQNIERGLGGATARLREIGRPGFPGGMYQLQFRGGRLGRTPWTVKMPRTLVQGEPSMLGLPEEAADRFMISGRTQKTLRAAPHFKELERGGRIRSSLNHTEWILRRMQEKMVPAILDQKRLDARWLRQETKAIVQHATGFAQYIPMGVVSDPMTRFQAMMYAQNNIIMGPGGDPLTQEQFKEFLSLPENAAYHAAPAPKRATADWVHGRYHLASTFDYRTMSWLPTEFPAGQRPASMFKPFLPTQSAVQAMQGSLRHQASAWIVPQRQMELFEWGQIARAGPGLPEGPFTAASPGADFFPRVGRLYFGKGYEKQLEGLMGEGESLSSRAIMPMLGMQQPKPVTLLADPVSKILSGAPAKELIPGSGRFMFEAPLTFEQFLAMTKAANIKDPSALLGFTERGKPFEIGPGRTIYGYEAISPPNEGAPDTIRLTMYEDLTTTESEKLFGPKGRTLFMGQKRFRRLAKELSGAPIGALTSAEQIWRADVLRKNQSQLHIQMLTALQQFNITNTVGYTQLNKALYRFPGEAGTFMDDPAAFMKGYEAMVAKEGPMAGVKQAFQMARQSELQPWQMGLVFGGVPEALGIEPDVSGLGDIKGAGLRKIFGMQTAFEKLGMSMSFEEAKWTSKGIAYGVGEMHYGGPKELTGAGRIGRLEPRFFEILSGKHYGESGQFIRRELFERAAVWNPGALKTQGLMGAALAEALGKSHEVPLMGIRKMPLASLTDLMLDPESASFIGREGALIEMDKAGGLDRLLLPPAEDVSRLAPYASETGRVFQQNLMKQYLDVLKGAKGGVEGLEGRVDLLRKGLAEAYAASVLGQGGIAGGDIPGSRRLTITTGDIENLLGKKGGKPDLRTVYVNELQAKRMLGELQKVYGAEIAEGEQFFGGPFMNLTKAQQEAYTKSMMWRGLEQDLMAGRSVQGLVSRDPAIGAYSILPARIQMVKGLEQDTVAIPEVTRNVLYGGKSYDVKMGLLPGMAADKDADTAVVTLLSPRSASRAYMSNEFWRDYDSYIIRNQLFGSAAKTKESVTIRDLMTTEARVASGRPGLTIREQEIADILKLGTAQSYVPRVSSSLMQAKTAVLESNLNAARQLRLLGAFELMEQIPIAGKHLSSEQVFKGHMAGIFTRIEDMVKRGSASDFERVMQDMIAAAPEGHIARELLGGGVMATVEGRQMALPGLELRETASSFQEVFEPARESGLIRKVRTMRSAAKGRFRGGLDDMLSMLSMDYGPWAEAKMPILAANTMSRKTTAIWNEITSLGGDAMKVASKPLAIGFGAAIGLGMLLSKPTSNLEPGSSRPLRDGLLKPRRIGIAERGDMFPDQGVSGEPTAPSLMAQPTARVGPHGAARVRVRAHSRGIDYNELGNSMAQRLPGRNNININVNDRRDKLTAQRISRIINGD